MMATRAIKPKREETMLTGWRSIPERAPSLMLADTPTVARFLAMLGVLLSAVGLLAMVAPSWRFNYVVAPGWGFFLLSIGLVFVLFHAFRDGELQFRLMYSLFSLALLAIGVALRVIPSSAGMGALFLPYGVPLLTCGFLFAMGVLHHDANEKLSHLLLLAVGVLSAVMIAAGLGVGQINANFLAVEGLLLLLLGLVFVSGFIGMQSPTSNVGYAAGLVLGLAAAVNLAITLIRIFAPTITGGSSDYLVPSGLIMAGVSVLYICISLGICSDWSFIVLVRRELASFFYSPVAYLVLIGITIIGWIMFWVFLSDIILRRGMFEPIVNRYIINLIPIIGQMFVVPILTMRLLSEEKRTGTLEQLLTAPVNESTVVLSKFFASLIFYLLTWMPWWIFLIALRVMGGEEFDYRPILSFAFALIATGSGFMAMGLFFSSVTQNQIIAAVLTFVGMMFHMGTYLVSRLVRWGPESVWPDVFTYVSFIDLWSNTLDGALAPRMLLFHVSLTVFFLYLTVKVLESRKWK
ncbi:MAG: ABC transporter permease [Planctomycetes bacterium]|nr:ABC transporter permease [Planctomycetota bacterium]